MYRGSLSPKFGQLLKRIYVYINLKAIVANIKRVRPIIFELALTDDDREEGFLSKYLLKYFSVNLNMATPSYFSFQPMLSKLAVVHPVFLKNTKFWSCTSLLL